MPRVVGGASVGYGVQTPAIECRGLTKRYGSHRGIEGVDLTVERGEIFGFIGPNGAGKSTTIRCLLGLVRKTSGEARVLGFDIERERTAILARTGYLPSEVAFYDRMRARELLRYAASFYPDSAACLERAHELSERLELDEDARVDDMSLGNRKKVGIVVSLMHAPDLLVLDEPTSGLDPLVQREFFDIVREENARGVTVLFSSHVLSEVQRICGRVAVIRQGSIVDVRSVAELRTSAIKQVRVLTGGGREESFVHQGSCNALVERLSRLDVADLEVGEPSLEELFLHYYEDGAEEPDSADHPVSRRRSGLGLHAEAPRRKGGLR
ncbi:MAG: ABC transporter ATP-binding protein [Coriobacteriia bacterium]|nr:ABC transporter ATP-binding protein [Coriobacteriia bacterium]MBS5477425.1 ABC transporter ATP-binding protein [Coriobacteriia bacterium]